MRKMETIKKKDFESFFFGFEKMVRRQVDNISPVYIATARVISIGRGGHNYRILKKQKRRKKTMAEQGWKPGKIYIHKNYDVIMSGIYLSMLLCHDYRTFSQKSWREVEQCKGWGY